MAESLEEKRKKDPLALRDISVSGEDMGAGYSAPTDFETVKRQLEEEKRKTSGDEGQLLSKDSQVDLAADGQSEQKDLFVDIPEGSLENPTFDGMMAIRYASTQDNPVEAYTIGRQKGGLWSSDQILQQASEVSLKATANAVEMMARDGNVPDPEAIETILQEDRDKFQQETGPEWAMVEQIEGTEDLPEDELRGIVAELYVSRKIGSLLKDQGVLGTVSDIAGMVLLPDESYNAAMFWSELTGDDEHLASFLGSKENLLKIGSWFRDLSPEEKVDVVPLFMNAAKEVEDNEIQQVMMMLAATGREDPEELKYGHLLDKVGVATGVGGVVANVFRAASLSKSLVKMKKTRDAAVVADNVMTGNIKPSEAQLHPVDAAHSGLPTVTDDLANLLDTAPEGVASDIRETWAKMDAIKAEGLDVVIPGMKMQEAEIAKVIEREEKRLRSSLNIENLKFNIKDDGVEFIYDEIDPDPVTGRLSGTLAKTEKIKYKQSDITLGFEQDRLGPVSDTFSSIVSPNAQFNKIRDVLVQPFELSAASQAKLRSRMTDTLRVATKELKGNKDSLKRVSDLLLKGTKEDEVYTYHQAVNKGIGGKRYTDSEYKTYINIRKLYDDMFFLKNDEIKKKLDFRGAKLVTLANGQRGYPSVADTPANAWKKYEASRYSTVLDDTAGGELKKLTREELDDIYDEGKVLVRLDNNAEFWFKNDSKAKFAIVDETNIEDIPEIVLDYRKGYAPLLYQNANFFVKAKRSVDDIANGKLKYNDTLRVFDNVTDAEDFAKQYARDNNLPDEDIVTVFNREQMTDADIEEDVINMFGGFAASPRKSERLPFGKDGIEAEFTDPIEALQQYMFHISNRIPITELRLATEQRWLNAAKKAVGDSYRPDFDEMLGIVKASDRMDEAKKSFLIRSHEQISTLNHIPTDGEQILQGKFVSIGKGLERMSPKLKGISKQMYTVGQHNPVGAVKAGVHHAFLGTLSLAQYPVQALGATIAMSINPTYAAKGMGKFFAFTTLDNIKDPAARASAIKRFSKIKGLNLEDLEDAYSLWRRSGYRESAMITSGDYATLAHGLPYDGNLVQRMFDKAAFPFKAGELVNMRISFATAYERWRDLNKGKKLDDVALQEIFARAENFRLNMGQGNKARFQKGIISIPLQFQQINTKFAEAVLGDTFTWKEKASLLLGQTALFGAIGVPFGEAMLAHFYDITDTDMSEMTEEELNAKRRGFMGWLFNNYLGIDAEIASRTAIAGGITDLAIDMVFEDHDLMGLAGPAGGLTERALEGVKGIFNAAKVTFSHDDISPEILGNMISLMAQSVAEVPSGTRNILLAYDLYDSNLVTDRFGKPLWNSDPDKWDILFQGIGFQGLTKSEYWDLIKNERSRQEREKAIADRLTWFYTRSLRSAEEGDTKGSIAANMTIANIYSSIKDPDLRQRIQDTVANRFKGDDNLRQAVETELMYRSDKATPASNIINLLPRRFEEGNL